MNLPAMRLVAKITDQTRLYDAAGEYLGFRLEWTNPTHHDLKALFCAAFPEYLEVQAGIDVKPVSANSFELYYLPF